jgi:hypothetical protein
MSYSPSGTLARLDPASLERSAVLRGWRVPEAVRRRVVARAALDLRSDDSETRHRASLVILRCVSQDIAIERIASIERTGKRQAQATALGTAYAAALADPQVRELLHQLDHALVEGTASAPAQPQVLQADTGKDVPPAPSCCDEPPGARR